MSELDALVQRTVDTVTMIANKAARFSTKLLLGVVLVCATGFALGIAALSGLSSGMQQVWIVLGLVFGSIAIGSAFVARWRLGAIKRHVPELANEVRSLLGDGRDSTRTVIETFAVDADGDGEADMFEDRGSPIVLSRQMYGFKRIAGSGLESSAAPDRRREGDHQLPGVGAGGDSDQHGVRLPRVHLLDRAGALTGFQAIVPARRRAAVMRRAAGIAASRPAALLRHSRSSSSGTLSATMPAPA